MKISFLNSNSFAVFALALTMLGLPQLTIAQRFNHGGAEPAARPAMQESRPSAPPAPRPEPSRPVAQAPRFEARPAASQPRQTAPATEARGFTINGGARNFGNHDLGRANTAAAPIVNPVPNNSAPANRDARGNDGHTNNNANLNNNPRGIPRGNPNPPGANPNRGDRSNVYHTGDYNGLHPYSYHPYHPYYWGPRWHPIGYLLSALAATAVRISYNNQYYYYDDGS